MVEDYSLLQQLAGTARLASETLRWIEWPRYSNRSHQSIRMGGWVGSLQYQQVDPALLPLLRTGSCLHLGKATVWGMGKYRIT